MGAETEQPPENNAEQRPQPSAATLTPDQFLSWKRQKTTAASAAAIAVASSSENVYLEDAAEAATKAEASRKRAEDIAAGTVQMNGRELFIHEPWVFDNSQY